MTIDCPFCQYPPSKQLLANDLAFAITDGFPLSPGHCLIIPRRHFPSLFEATREERAALWELLDQARDLLLTQHHPDGFNIGINDGAAAGQTVMHLHIHLIPRYSGDTVDPRGGIRWIMPDKAPYWDE
jgi:diadenosine tetraphosphate (Ap4A) HIT family hydrolase